MTERLALFNWVTFRLILPFTLLAACVFRFNLFTVVYGIFFLLVPLARSPNTYTIRRHTGALIWALTAVSGLFMLAQISFQIALAARKPYGHEFPNCELNENITRQVGVYRLDSARFIHVARLVLPDVAVFVVAATLAVFAYQIRSQSADAPSNADSNLRWHRETRPGLVRMFTELIILIFVAFAGIISPSLISSIYFLCYMFIGTFWACLGNAEKLFVNVVRYALLVFTAGHLAVTYLYQMDFIQNLVDKDALPARLTGLLAIIRVDCGEPRDLRYHTTPWYNFVSPGVLVILYYLLASHIRQWKGYTTNPWSDVEASLLRGNQRPVAYDVAHQTVTIQPASPHSEASSHHYRIRMLLNYFARVLARQSYIGSLICMMAWSVIYHSWLTFVFLLLAIFLWLIPSSRSFCLKFSPVYTLYAIILVTAQFIFSLNIQKEFDDMNATSYIDFRQIGFQRYAYPVFDLAIQCLFTFSFWTTLRLFMHERQAIRQRDENGVNLDEVTNGGFQDPGSVIMSEYFDPGTHSWLWRIGRSIKILMIKFWIVLCGAMLVVISMKGKVVIYRIVYMALLLCFVVMLQVSYRFWRKMLYVFWVTVIFYSMVVLLLIYTYQFKNFPEYWQNFTSLPKETLEDFGLESYPTKGALVVELLTPTAFLILCILQLHYFHKHFLAITSKQDGTYKFPSFQIPQQQGDLAKPSGFAIRCLQFTYKWSHLFFDLLWRLLEIHILKVCLFVILLAAVVDPSAINLIFILLVAISLMAYNGVSVVAQSSSTIAAVLVIVKMVYQLRMVGEEPFAANCSFLNASNYNRTDNDWVGFRKVGDIAYELRVYISVILIVTLRAIIVHRHRFFMDSVPANQQPKPGIVFADITQKDADTGLVSCMKYLINYGFYRFGLEICFMTMVINMCSRLDIFSVLYGVLLLVMFMLSRRALAKIWGVYVVVLGLLLPIQYLLVLGIPRGLCITYPWDRLQATTIFTAEMVQWLYLPDAFSPPKAMILIGDFFQLLFACCQWRVFNLETLYHNEPYEGGTNESIIVSGKYRHIFENMVPDFMTSTKSYLDFVKYFVFNFMFWVTLAVVFVAGTSRISLLCFFYLLGCFFFLWHGNEFLRKPIRQLLRQWNVFLTGNVIIILLKVILQVVGCIHLPALKQNYCWVIQLLGIACLRVSNHRVEETAIVPRDLPNTDVTKAGGNLTEGICKASTDDAGMVLDAVVFVFLLLQKRIFQSWHFQWVVLEHKVQSALASRGAELIRNQVAEQTKRQKVDEAKVMEKIRRKMEKIRAKQVRRRGALAILPPDYIVPPEVLGDPTSPYFEEHYQTTRAGDAYMFEDSDSEEEDIDLAPSRPPEEAEPTHASGPDPLQMLNYAVMMDDIKTTVQDIKAVNDRSESERAGSEYASPGQQRLSLMQLAQRRNTMGSSNERRYPISEPPSTSAAAPPILHLSPVHSLTFIAEADREHSPMPSDFPPPGHMPRSVSDTEAMTLAHREKIENADRDEIPENEAAAGEPRFDVGAAVATGWEKAYHVFVFAKMFVSRIIDVVNDKLNVISKDFRFVADKLRVEKRRLKRNYVQKVREFFERDMVAGAHEVALAESDEQVDQAIQGLEKAALSKPGLLKHQKSELHLELPDRSEEEFQSKHNVLVRLAIASYYALTARSELLCYFMIIILQMTSASALSLPLPLMMFMWGTLSIPRPKRAFWVTIISYTMVIVLVKYIFQFSFIPDEWSSYNQADPLYPPKILGVEKASHYASVDLALLLVVFFHRSVLKTLGLWRSAREEQEEQENVVVAVVSSTTSPMEKQRNLEGVGTSFAPEVQFTPDIEHKEFKLPAESKPAFYTRYLQKTSNFFTVLTAPATDRLNTNVYSWMFYCDFVCFVIVVAFYWAFGPDAGSGDNIKDYFEENRIPTAFLVILIVQFLLMILERALYLRKNLKGKLIFQLLLVLTVHGVFFFYLPKETGRAFTDKFSYPVKIWYFVKCVYFLLSAYQIRSGYPTRILGNIFTYGYHYINLYAFKCFILIPFLMELRSLMDWIWTDTSMSMAEWLKLEDIYANIFVLKCWRMAEKRYPTPRGTRYMTFWKYLMGGSILLLIILVIWFPLVLFSLTDAVGDSNIPLDCTIEVNLGGHQPIYRVTARKEALVNYSQEMYDNMLNKFSRVGAMNGMNDQAAVKQAQSFIHQYAMKDVYLVHMEADSSRIFGITPPAEADLVRYLNRSAEIRMYFKWTFRFAARKGKVSQVISGEANQILGADVRSQIGEMLMRTNNTPLDPVRVVKLYPFYVRVPSVGLSRYATALQPPGLGPTGLIDPQANFRNASAQLKREPFPGMAEVVQWWKVYDPDPSAKNGSSDAGEFLMITAFIDKVFPQAWAAITGYGIVGLYVSLVFLVGRLLRLWSSNQSYRIMYEDLPNVDRILHLCQNIYLVRENREYRLEEDLYAKLLYLYRSPETIFRWTKIKTN